MISLNLCNLKKRKQKIQIKPNKGHPFREQIGDCQRGGKWAKWVKGSRGTDFQVQNKSVMVYNIQNGDHTQ